MDMYWVFSFFIFCAWLHKRSNADYISVEDLTSPEFYKINARPTSNKKGPNTSVKVTLRIQIEKVEHVVKDNENFFAVKMKVYQKWFDNRLIFPDTASNPFVATSKENAIWCPDLIFINEQENFDVTESFRVSRIYANGTVYSKVRVTVKAYPLKTDLASNAVTLRIISYNHQVEDLYLAWSKEMPISVSHSGIYYPSAGFLENKDFMKGVCNSSGIARVAKTTRGNYSCLYFIISHQSKMPALLLVYVPSALCVAISWSAFWMDNDAVLGRTLVTLTVLIHLIAQKVAITREVFAVDHLDVLNTWLHCCIGFAVAALLQVVAVSYIYGHSMNRYQKNWASDDCNSVRMLEERKDDGAAIEEIRGQEKGTHSPTVGALLRCLPCFSSEITTAETLNAISRWIFPLFFVICLIVFRL